MKTLFLDMEYVPEQLNAESPWFSLKAIIESDAECYQQQFLIKSANTKLLQAALKTCRIDADHYAESAVDADTVLNWLSDIECETVASENIDQDVAIIAQYAKKFGMNDLWMLSAKQRQLDAGDFQQRFSDKGSEELHKGEPNTILRIIDAKPKTLFKRKRK